MLALDVDGTIALRDYTVPDAIKAAIQEAMATDVIVSLVTGRIRASALRYAEECDVNGPTISHQGAVTTAPDGVTDLHIERLEPQTAGSALSLIREAGAQVSVFADDEIWVEEETDWAAQYAVRMKKELQMNRPLDAVVMDGPIVVMGVDGPERITDLVGTLRSDLGNSATVTRSLPHFCEVTSPNANKAHSLARVCSDYGISADEVIAIGDGAGDASMIEWAGLGVACGDAHLEAAQAADLHIAGPEADGVAHLIHDLLNQGNLGRYASSH